MSWDESTYLARIENSSTRCRHAAGSPTGIEIETYARACDAIDPRGTVVILGMTPELRELAARKFPKTIAIDHSETAIKLFRDWLPEDLQKKETLIHDCWTSLPDHLDAPVSGILGDGILANLPDRHAVKNFLGILANALTPDGVCIMRNVMVPEPFDPDRYLFPKLLENFRNGRIDAAEFGFTARILGFHDSAYDAKNESLDNAKLYGELDEMKANGLLDDTEWKAISRYRFMGKNFLPDQKNWDSLMIESGFTPPIRHHLTGKLWYEYYPIDSLFPHQV